MENETNYSELLFAYHVRELAMKRLVHETPEGLSPEAATRYMFERFEPTVIGVVRELQNVATMIRKAGPALPDTPGMPGGLPSGDASAG
jgi:tRNA A37 threonylcarbamoyltransferase TsaD